MMSVRGRYRNEGPAHLAVEGNIGLSPAERNYIGVHHKRVWKNFPVDDAVLVFPGPKENKAEITPVEFFDAGNSVCDMVQQRAAFDNRDLLRPRKACRHQSLPSFSNWEIVTHNCHTRNHKVLVTALDSSSFFSRAQNAAGWLQPTKRSAVAFHHPLAAFLPREAFVICASQLVMSARKLGRANAALSFTSCATTDLSALPRTAHTKRGAVEATPAPRSHHTARRQRAA